MAKRTLNDRMLKALKPAAMGKRYDVMDALMPGFGVRVTDKGTKTFVLVARFPGYEQPTRRAIGEYGELTLEAARAKARDWHALIRTGKDPRSEEERTKAEQLRRDKNSFTAVAEEFIKRHVSKMRKAKEVERNIRREFIDRWAERPITNITRHDVMAVLNAAVDRGSPYQAHNLLGYIRRLFNWAISRGTYGLETSPCDRLRPVDAIGPKKSRRRILSDDELRAFWKCTGKTPYPYGPLLQLLLATGQRLSMVSEASRNEFDFNKKLWLIPAERMKGDNPHLVPLTQNVIDIIEGLPEFRSGDFLFSTTYGKKPIRAHSLSKTKRRLDAAMLAELQRMAGERGDDPSKVKLAPWVLHDLRRTMRSGLSALPIEEHVRELVIGHVRPGISGVYDLFAYVEEKRQALELWGARLRSIVTPPPANVVALRGQNAQQVSG
jgi:integrase